MITPSTFKSKVPEASCLQAVNAKCSHKALGRCLWPLQYCEYMKNDQYKIAMSWVPKINNRGYSGVSLILHIL